MSWVEHAMEKTEKSHAEHRFPFEYLIGANLCSFSLCPGGRLGPPGGR